MTGLPLKVVIVDDHPLILEGIRRVLEHAENIEVVGEAQSVRATLSLIERRLPDIVVLDLLMPDADGIGHIEEIRSTWPDLKIVVLSSSEDEASVDAAVQAGADAFVGKSVGVLDMASILRQVAAGVFLAPSRPRTSVDRARMAARPDLTEREQAILLAIADGKTTAQIGQDLFISDHTVKFHLTNLYRKLGVSNRAAAVRWAVEKGLARR